MGGNSTAHTGNVGGRNEEQRGDYTHGCSVEQLYPNSAQSQRQQILNWLHRAPLTTLQARRELDIMHPAARIQELRGRGHNIITLRAEGDTGKARHRVACYVLLSGGV